MSKSSIGFYNNYNWKKKKLNKELKLLNDTLRSVEILNSTSIEFAMITEYTWVNYIEPNDKQVRIQERGAWEWLYHSQISNKKNRFI